MQKWFERKFAISALGAKGLWRATLASLVVYIVTMGPVFLLLFFAEKMFVGQIRDPLLYAGASIAVCAALYFALSVEYDRLYSATYKESAALRIDISERLAQLPLSYFSKHDLSDLAQSVMADVEAVEHAMSHAIPKVYALYLFLPILGVLLLWGNLKLGLAVIVPILCRYLVLALFWDRSTAHNDRYHKVLRENSERFQEAIEMYREIRDFQLADATRGSLYSQMDHSEAVHIKTEGATLLTVALSGLFSFVGLGVVLVVGTHLMANGEISLLYLLGYILSAIKLKDLVDVSSELSLEICYIAPRVARIREIKEAEVQRGRQVQLERFDIELENVGFSYKDTPVLRGVGFTAKQGEVTALVGPSGCGKSTILKLISRLYDYDEGSIRIGGNDIREIHTDSLFAYISVVFQDVTLFNGSILENIRIGRKDATDAEVMRAARLAHCTEFIERLPQGFDTLIGENGAELSGGERQRLSIARAFLKDAPILLLDEISASLDVENERKIQESLRTLIGDKTVIVVSHRMKSIENADSIVVLDDGEVQSVGRHETLRSESPVYENLIEKSAMSEAFVY